MNAKKLARIKSEIASARRRANTHRNLEGIAVSLGRKRLKGARARGKEPSYESTVFPRANLITIPDHNNRTFGPGTQNKILDQIEEDVDRWEAKFKEGKQTVSKGNGYGKY